MIRPGMTVDLAGDVPTTLGVYSRGCPVLVLALPKPGRVHVCFDNGTHPARRCHHDTIALSAVREEVLL